MEREEEHSDKNQNEWHKLPIVWIIIAIAIGYFLINLPTWQQAAEEKQVRRDIQQSMTDILNAAIGPTSSSINNINP